jgi:hypothetical protein
VSRLVDGGRRVFYRLFLIDSFQFKQRTDLKQRNTRIIKENICKYAMELLKYAACKLRYILKFKFCELSLTINWPNWFYRRHYHTGVIQNYLAILLVYKYKSWLLMLTRKPSKCRVDRRLNQQNCNNRKNNKNYNLKM